MHKLVVLCPLIQSQMECWSMKLYIKMMVLPPFYYCGEVLTPGRSLQDTDTITSWYLFNKVCAMSHTPSPLMYIHHYYVHCSPTSAGNPFSILSLFLAAWLSCYTVCAYITIILTSRVLNHTSLTYKYLAMSACVRYYSYFHSGLHTKFLSTDKHWELSCKQYILQCTLSVHHYNQGIILFL
jgi:hypothetical protein